MAEKPKDEKKKPKKHTSGGMPFGLEVLLFVVAVFVVWLLVGKPKSENADKPFIKGDSITILK